MNVPVHQLSIERQNVRKFPKYVTGIYRSLPKSDDIRNRTDLQSQVNPKSCYQRNRALNDEWTPTVPYIHLTIWIKTLGLTFKYDSYHSYTLDLVITLRIPIELHDSKVKTD